MPPMEGEGDPGVSIKRLSLCSLNRIVIYDLDALALLH